MNSDISYLLARGVAEVIVRDELVELLRSGNKLRLKEGFDPSFPDIHLGHMVALRKLRQFQELGHKVVLIVGDWTAQIGDPSGASVTRPMLSAEQVKANAQTYMEQFFKIVDRSKTEVRWQSEWFGKFNLADVIRLTSRFTVAQLLARDDFNKRFNDGRPIAVTELLYPLLQAYDSVVVQADIEFGGIDQKFNILAGRELQAMMGQRSQQCLMTPLLVGTDGNRKMSKSLGNYIGVAEPPPEIYGKIMSVTDNLILQYFELLTDVGAKELAEFKQTLSGGAVNPMLLKKRLAREIITQLDGEAAALEAEKHFEKVVQKKEMPDDVPEIKMTPGLIQKIQDRSREESGHIVSIKEVGKSEATRDWIVSVPLLLCAIGLAKSGSEARRLIEQKSIRIDGKTIYMDETRGSIRIGSIIQVGKRRYIRIVADEPST